MLRCAFFESQAIQAKKKKNFENPGHVRVCIVEMYGGGAKDARFLKISMKYIDLWYFVGNTYDILGKNGE